MAWFKPVMYKPLVIDIATKPSKLHIVLHPLSTLFNVQSTSQIGNLKCWYMLQNMYMCLEHPVCSTHLKWKFPSLIFGQYQLSLKRSRILVGFCLFVCFVLFCFVFIVSTWQRRSLHLPSQSKSNSSVSLVRGSLTFTNNIYVSANTVEFIHVEICILHYPNIASGVTYTLFTN